MKHTYIYILVSLLFTINSYSQTLNDYLVIAAQNDPELQALQYRYQSALEKVTEVGSLPNTTIGVGYFLQEAETRVGAQKAKFSVSQKLPWFGTLAAKEESASFKALAQLNTIDFAKRNLFLGIKKTYFELYELKAKELVDRGAPTLTQAAVADFIHEGHFERHLKRLRKVYGRRRQTLTRPSWKH